MSNVSAALWFDGSELSKQNLTELGKLCPPQSIFVCHKSGTLCAHTGPKIEAESLFHGQVIKKLLSGCRTELLFLVVRPAVLEIDPAISDQMQTAFAKGSSSLGFSGFFIKEKGKDGPGQLQPLIDCQEGAVRDDFDFGHLICIDVERAKETLKLYSWEISDNLAGFYGFRLITGLAGLPVRLPQPLYSAQKPSAQDAEKEHFKYVERSSLASQKILEATFTAFARKAGFYLPQVLKKVQLNIPGFAVEASVIIPVKDREKTVTDAVKSALSQKTSFEFNVIVIDNHSRDGTSEKLAELASTNKKIIHVLPPFSNLGIGGCWNEAIFHPKCGKFAIQLDSDDTYSSSDTLQRIVDAFYSEQVAAVVGSYRVVNMKLQEIPPGLIDHREWTEDNGHNNALRINGFGAPRAFFTPVAREIRFPNVSYGEDYSVMLGVTRQYRIGRIYDVLYNCRRWEGNSDAKPSIEKQNAHNFYKDTVRTQEISRRRQQAARLAAQIAQKPATGNDIPQNKPA